VWCSQAACAETATIGACGRVGVRFIVDLKLASLPVDSNMSMMLARISGPVDLAELVISCDQESAEVIVHAGHII